MTNPQIEALSPVLEKGNENKGKTPEEEGFQQAADLLGSALQHEVWDRGKTACTHENTPGMKTKSDLFFN